jgi:hypothetical protein
MARSVLSILTFEDYLTCVKTCLTVRKRPDERNNTHSKYFTQGLEKFPVVIGKEERVEYVTLKYPSVDCLFE